VDTSQPIAGKLFNMGIGMIDAKSNVATIAARDLIAQSLDIGDLVNVRSVPPLNRPTTYRLASKTPITWEELGVGVNIVFAIRSTFPMPGVAGVLYVATDTNAIFRWDAALATPDYVSVGGSGGNELVFAAKSAFPAIGSVGFLYIDIDSNMVYRWDSDLTTPDYVPVGGAGRAWQIFDMFPSDTAIDELEDGDMFFVEGVGNTYIHVQAVASNTWNVLHNLGVDPHFIRIMVDADVWGMSQVFPDLLVSTNNLVVIRHAIPLSGRAYLSL